MKRMTALVLLALGASLLLGACGVGAPGVGTPIPPMPEPYAGLQAPAQAGLLAARWAGSHCEVYAVDMLGYWVAAGTPEKEPFTFTDVNGLLCTASFPNDVLFILAEANVWYPGAPACSNCHGPELAYSYAMLNLHDYQGILAGSRRPTEDAKGNDILGGGKWEEARLFQVLNTKWMPLGRPATLSEKGPLLPAGKPK